MEMQLRILHLISTLDPQNGGVAQAVINIIEALPETDHAVVCLDEKDSSFLQEIKFPVFPLGAGKTPWNYNPLLKPWLVQNVNNYSHVIVHGLWQYQSLAIMHSISKAAYRGALFVMPHGMLDPWFQKASGRRLKALRNVIIYALIEKKLINSSTAVLFTCQEELRLAGLPFKPYKPRKEVVVGLGVLPSPPFRQEFEEDFQRSVPALKNNSYWLFLSRIHPKKGVDLLVDAYSTLSMEKPDLPHLVIAGPLDSDYALEMKQRAFGNNKIHFTGMLRGNAKWGALYGCKMFILPSHQENFGIAVVEAMACGKGVAITRNVNIWTVIQESGAGVVFDATRQDVENVLKQLADMSEHDREIAGNLATQAYRENYLPEQAGKRILEVIKSF